MQTALVMTVIGRDRTGLVESVARLVAENGGNWLESRMCRLGGEFAGILRVHIPNEKTQALIQALESLKAQGLTVITRPDQAASTLKRERLASLELVGQDRPGIVQHVSAVLTSQGVNVEELTTERTSAPMSGESLFRAAARLRLPDSCVVSDLRKELETVAGDLMVDISFVELPANQKVR